MRNMRSILGLMVVAVVVLAGGYAAFRPTPDSTMARGSSLKVLELAVGEAGSGSSDLPVFQARAGDVVRLEISSAINGTLSVHDYEQNASLSAGETVHLEFPAVHSGRFGIHVHASDGAHLEAGVLEISPGASAGR